MGKKVLVLKKKPDFYIKIAHELYEIMKNREQFNPEKRGDYHKKYLKVLMKHPESLYKETRIFFDNFPHIHYLCKFYSCLPHKSHYVKLFYERFDYFSKIKNVLEPSPSPYDLYKFIVLGLIENKEIKNAKIKLDLSKTYMLYLKNVDIFNSYFYGYAPIHVVFDNCCMNDSIMSEVMIYKWLLRSSHISNSTFSCFSTASFAFQGQNYLNNLFFKNSYLGNMTFYLNRDGDIHFFRRVVFDHSGAKDVILKSQYDDKENRKIEEMLLHLLKKDMHWRAYLNFDLYLP